jgi:hypothetical protein
MTRPSKPSAQPSPDGSGIIPAGSVLTLEAAKRELGLTASALRAMRRSGLVVRRIGKRGFILSNDLIQFLEKVNP